MAHGHDGCDEEGLVANLGDEDHERALAEAFHEGRVEPQRRSGRHRGGGKKRRRAAAMGCAGALLLA
jgi:hypothetical protein